jgi:hypothetical protein
VNGISNRGKPERKSRSGILFQRTHRLVVCCNDARNKIYIHNFDLRGMYNMEAVDVSKMII